MNVYVKITGQQHQLALFLIIKPLCFGLSWLTLSNLPFSGMPTCHHRVVEVFRRGVQVDHLHRAAQGLTVLDHRGAVGALKRTTRDSLMDGEEDVML